MEKGRSSDNLARQSFDTVGDGYRVCVIGNLNRWVGDSVRKDIANIAGEFAVPGENRN